MHQRSYESLATEHLDALRQEAANQRLASTTGRERHVQARILGATALMRGWVTRAASVGRRHPVPVARAGRDLGAS